VALVNFYNRLILKLLNALVLVLLFGNLMAQKKLSTVESQNVMEKMKIEIWSDIACPFCFIGKRHLEEALKNFANASDIEIVWKSFQLDPGLAPSPGQNLYESLAERKGWSVAQTKQITQNVIQMGKSAGIDFKFDEVVPANTLKAHYLLQYAKSKGKGDEVKEALLKAYFIEGKDMADEETLIKIAHAAGLKDFSISEFSNDLWSQQMQTDIYESRQVGVQGVPFFVFNNQYAVSGAQPVKVFGNTIEKAYQDWQKSRSKSIKMTAEGNVCIPEQECK
jgi:predicted DsbA family dithiol-disulfide isomerase